MRIIRLTLFPWPMMVLIIFICLVESCSLISDRKSKDALPVVVDLSRNIGEFKGMGANIPIGFYNRRTKPLQVLSDLHVKVIRVKRSRENWDDILALKAATHRLRIKWIYSLDHIPQTFLDDKNFLVDVDGFADWWAEEVDELNYQEVPADYIELVDSPDGSHESSPVMDSDTYNRLLHSIRRELDYREYQNVQIIGPGLSDMGVDHLRETWYIDLDQQAFEMISNWSVALFDDTTRSLEIDRRTLAYSDYLKKIESQKPIFVTTYGNQQNQYGKNIYPHPEHYDILGNKDGYERYYYSASFSTPFGLRVYSNTLKLLTQANVTPFIHQLYDAPDDVKFKKRSWGWLDLNGEPKPVYSLLSNLFKMIPEQASIIPVELDLQSGLTAMAFVGQEKIIVTVCSESLAKKDIQVLLKGLKGSLEFTAAQVLSTPIINSPDLGRMDQVVKNEESLKMKRSSVENAHSFKYTIEPNTVLLAEFSIR